MPDSDLSRKTGPSPLSSVAKINLDALAMLHAKSCIKAEGYATSTHAGVGHVLLEIAHQARVLAAESLDHYDNRLLYALAAQLEQAGRPAGPAKR
jgi:hypothetical protein